MTKTIRDNFTGLESDDDESIGFTFVERNGQNLFKWEGDVDTKYFFNEVLGKMVKPPRKQVWVRLSKDEVEKQGRKGYWEKVQ